MMNIARRIEEFDAKQKATREEFRENLLKDIVLNAELMEDFNDMAIDYAKDVAEEVGYEISHWNEYAISHSNNVGEIYYMDEFDDQLDGYSPSEIADMIAHGGYYAFDDYFMFKDGGIVTMGESDALDEISYEDEFIEWYAFEYCDNELRKKIIAERNEMVQTMNIYIHNFVKEADMLTIYCEDIDDDDIYGEIVEKFIEVSGYNKKDETRKCSFAEFNDIEEE